MSDYRDSIQIAADTLAAQLRPHSWYHRTMLTWVPGGYHLSVYGESKPGQCPAEVPTEFMGYPVQFNRVTKRNPCPFGSVKA